MEGGREYSVRLQVGCEADAAVLYESASIVAGPIDAQCASSADQSVLFEPGYMAALNECGHSCWGKAKCTHACLLKRGLSVGCAGCWGDVVGCGAWNCWCVPARARAYRLRLDAACAWDSSARWRDRPWQVASSSCDDCVAIGACIS
jgi:hypothetical protein